jgi:hypothetical protein
MATNPQAVDFYTILQAIRTRVVTVTGLNDNYVRVCGSDDYEYDYEKQMVAIRPLGPEPVTDGGGGRQSRIEHRTIRVYCNVRNSSDPVGKDDIALQTLIGLENTVYDALDEFYPSSSGSSLTIEPLHPTQNGNSPPTRKPNDDIGEIFSMLTYEVVFVRINSIPPP